MSLDDAGADVETQHKANTGAATNLLLDAGDAVETLPDADLLGRRDAGAFIAHLETRVPPAVPRCRVRGSATTPSPSSVRAQTLAAAGM
jgi:hypothetical protein